MNRYMVAMADTSVVVLDADYPDVIGGALYLYASGTTVAVFAVGAWRSVVRQPDAAA